MFKSNANASIAVQKESWYLNKVILIHLYRPISLDYGEKTYQLQ